MKLTDAQFVVLKHIVDEAVVDITAVSEPFRQRAIDLGMMDPPLVDMDAHFIHATPDGRRALREQASD